jgi:hypothetical protein
MQTLASAPSLTPAYLKQNLQDIQDNVVAPIMMRHGHAIFLRNIALTSVLLPFAIGGFAQTQALLPANDGRSRSLKPMFDGVKGDTLGKHENQLGPEEVARGQRTRLSNAAEFQPLRWREHDFEGGTIPA